MTSVQHIGKATTKPDALDRFGERLSERVNPIVVKEVRQGLRTRTFSIFFTLMLLACLIISLIAVATGHGAPRRGKAYFIAYSICLGLVQFFVIPYSAYRSMAREREEETWVLLTLTGIGPRRILRGKMASFMLQGLLYTSAAAPFLLFSYYLNGIDLPTILLTVTAGIAWQLLLTSICVSMATVAASKLMRSVLHFVTLAILLQGMWAGLGLTAVGVEGSRTWFSSDESKMTAMGAIFMATTWGILLYESAAAHMSLETESYARGPRLALIGQMAGIAAIMWWAASSSALEGFLSVCVVLASIHLFTVGVFVASDRDGMSRALRQKNRFSLLEPGALRGFRLIMLLFAATTFVFMALNTAFHDESRRFWWLLAAPAYGSLYIAGAVILTRLASPRREAIPKVTRVVAFGLAFAGSGAPPLFGALMGADPEGMKLNLLSPVMGLYALSRLKTADEPVPYLLVLWVLTLVAVLAAQEMLVRADRRDAAQ